MNSIENARDRLIFQMENLEEWLEYEKIMRFMEEFNYKFNGSNIFKLFKKSKIYWPNFLDIEYYEDSYDWIMIDDILINNGYGYMRINGKEIEIYDKELFSNFIFKIMMNKNEFPKIDMNWK